jgi:hypothetical protein
MKKKLILMFPFILTLICLLSYNLIGSSIDSNGILREPFFLIPLGYLFLGMGIIGLTFNLFTRKKTC